MVRFAALRTLSDDTRACIIPLRTTQAASHIRKEALLRDLAGIIITINEAFAFLLA
jgi:hypothetical protein